MSGVEGFDVRRNTAALTTAAIVTTALLSPVAPASASSGRATVLCQSSSYRCIAASGYKGQSVWGSWGPGHNCVSYAAYRLRKNGAPKPWAGGIGDAKLWDDKARVAGIRVDHQPAVGAIAEWDAGTYGHVAYVEQVTADAIVVSEDAYVSDTHGFAQTRRLDRHGSQFATAHFIHVRDVSQA
jgi:surface antigen